MSSFLWKLLLFPYKWDLLLFGLKHSSVHLWNVKIKDWCIAMQRCLQKFVKFLYVEDVHYHKTKIYILNESSTMNNSFLSTKPWVYKIWVTLILQKYGWLGGWKLGFHDVSRLSSNPYKTWALLLFYCSLQKWQSFTIGIDNSQLINNTFFPKFFSKSISQGSQISPQKKSQIFFITKSPHLTRKLIRGLN